MHEQLATEIEKRIAMNCHSTYFPEVKFGAEMLSFWYGALKYGRHFTPKMGGGRVQRGVLNKCVLELSNYLGGCMGKELFFFSTVRGRKRGETCC